MTSQTVFALGEFQSPDIRHCQWSVWRENLQFGAHQHQLQHSDTLPSDCSQQPDWRVKTTAQCIQGVLHLLCHVAGYVKDMLGLA